MTDQRGLRVAEIPYAAEFFSWPTCREWQLWVVRHGFDPNQAVIPNLIIADDEARTVELTVIVRDPYARPVQLVQQLEAPALPFPMGQEGRSA